jgi:uncharacterized membrane protein
MIPKIVVIAIAGLLYALAQWLLPDVPISLEMLVTAILIILALLGVDVTELLFRGFVGRMRARGLWK